MHFVCKKLRKMSDIIFTHGDLFRLFDLLVQQPKMLNIFKSQRYKTEKSLKSSHLRSRNQRIFYLQLQQNIRTTNVSAPVEVALRKQYNLVEYWWRLWYSITQTHGNSRNTRFHRQHRHTPSVPLFWFCFVSLAELVPGVRLPVRRWRLPVLLHHLLWRKGGAHVWQQQLL